MNVPIERNFLQQVSDWLVCRLSFFSTQPVSNFSQEKVLTERGQTSTTAYQQAERVMTDHGNNILRLAYSYLHNLSDAEDILQDTLIQYLKAAPVFENPTHEKAWLLRVAANLSKNRIAYNSIRSTDLLMESLAQEGREDLSFVWEAVKTLPEKYREVIHLFYYEGYSTAEISKILKRKEGTIRSDLHRGREKLKLILKEVYDFEESVR